MTKLLVSTFLQCGAHHAGLLLQNWRFFLFIFENILKFLKKFYEDLKAAGKNFEVIFVSRDRTANDLKEYYNDHHGEWTYLEFGDPKIE